MRRLWIVAMLLAVVLLAGCDSKADKVSDNLSKEAEQFHVQRRVIGINGITDKVLFSVEGRCSLETKESKLAKALEITCKYGPHDFRKHYVGLSDNVTFVSTQLHGLPVSEYHTEFILRPTTIIPDLRLDVGG